MSLAAARVQVARMAGKNKTPSGLICPRLPAAVAGVAVVVVAAARLPDLAGDGDSTKFRFFVGF